MKALIACAALIVSATAAAAQNQPTSTPLDARAVFMNKEGKTIGSATLIDTPNGVLIRADIANLPPGPHGFHIHEVGRCDASGGFESAGGHYNPRGAKHGYWIEGGPHAGDLPNQTVGQDGKLLAEVFNPHVGFDGEGTLFDQDGSALVVHATADDYRSQPSGGAGDRIACAVIQRNR
ncbi:superoxide dismutase family protein [Microvirga splendida]|uniref:Superoxide dismutase [Cu-Zn] n=1 Tax=Microvirga splendida TaxID=2795727 RepID=A0ABS0Y3W2_9HYPH|nr:superoxide dismutase family protein [Microvirga splendida]MBJ6127000.1 superoxide dismutase family protein [Microvirga splendida]